MKCCDKPISLLLAGNLSFVLSWFLMLALPIVVSGQTPSSTSQEQMGKLDFLIGEWKGKGWFIDPKKEIRQTTKVKKGKDGLTLIISDKKSGEGYRTVSPPGVVIDHPLLLSSTASVYYDEKSKLYYWRPGTSAGRRNPHAAVLAEPKVLRVKLEFSAPHTISIMTIEITDDGEWHEKHEAWHSEEKGWVTMMETVLKKVK